MTWHCTVQCCSCLIHPSQLPIHLQRCHYSVNQVKIVSADMRSWQPPELADILVSELLGSFGDNELSPECLDGAQRLLRDDGVSIPCDYTSYLAPVTTAKLHEAVRAYKDLEHLETPYVVKFHKWVLAHYGVGTLLLACSASLHAVFFANVSNCAHPVI